MNDITDTLLFQSAAIWFLSDASSSRSRPDLTTTLSDSTTHKYTPWRLWYVAKFSIVTRQFSVWYPYCSVMKRSCGLASLQYFGGASDCFMQNDHILPLEYAFDRNWQPEVDGQRHHFWKPCTGCQTLLIGFFLAAEVVISPNYGRLCRAYRQSKWKLKMKTPHPNIPTQSTWKIIVR
jgi:hypothetical protein